ncbi:MULTISPECIES: S9 family peptidase [unclassified Pseudonocardia]|uniref:S9 family peptidase n=1 Tax=unclassified Pseudonocardia TaxID=2619320 RepID=UPI000A9BBBA3|nr:MULTISPECIES: S9 family peptidase [unclassified Pseudonocardia]
MSTPEFMSPEHVAIMREKLLDEPSVLAVCRDLDRAYGIAYVLDAGPDGEQVRWQMTFDPVTGVQVDLGDPAHADVMYRGDWVAVMRAAAVRRRGEEPADPLTVHGDPAVLERIGPAFAAAHRVAAIETSLPDVEQRPPQHARMGADVRDTPLYAVVAQHLDRLLGPTYGRPGALRDLEVSPDGTQVVVTATVLDGPDASPRTAILAVRDGSLELLTSDVGSAHGARFAPDGRTLAFLTDRRTPGAAEAALLRTGLGEAVAAPAVAGAVEYVRWSPDGRRLLLGVAGEGADRAAAAGSGTTAARPDPDRASWLPRVTSDSDDLPWRTLWAVDVDSGGLRRIGPERWNVWEADWAGSDAVVAIASTSPDEDAWYNATLDHLDLDTGDVRTLLTSDVQLAVPAGSPDGRRIAVVQALCSDRGIAAGALTVVDVHTAETHMPDTLGADVSDVRWIDAHRLGYAGLRRLESVAGTVDTTRWTVEEVVRSAGSLGGAAMHPAAAFAGDDVLTIQESYVEPQRIVRTSSGREHLLYEHRHAGIDHLRSIAGTATAVQWEAPDGLEIDGILCTPDGDGPFALVVNLHGGPVWGFRATQGMTYPWVAFLVSRGFAVLSPNPRGSSGRGRAFAERVVGDMGGADAHDVLAGITALVARGLADPDRVGLIGGSYGGFLSAWLPTLDTRIAAAVPMSPVTDWTSQTFTTNIARWGLQFLQSDPLDADSHLRTRSPVTYASRVRTPCLLVAGAHDRCTPPGQAEEFHGALRLHDVPSALVVYPEEGHGVRHPAARADLLTRVASWFERHMPQ